jgi:protein tyrosine/serine phosphatase
MTRRLLLTVVLLGVGQACAEMPNARPADWAQPVASEELPNLHRITPTLYRSAQPSASGARELRELGINTVINLRRFHSDKERLRGTGVKLLEMDINTWAIGDRDVIRVLKLLRHERGPFLIHCQHGADRTGLMSAMYRMVEQGWSKEAALEEMTRGGYGFHSAWRNIVRYIEKVDVERIRKAVEIEQ